MGLTDTSAVAAELPLVRGGGCVVCSLPVAPDAVVSDAPAEPVAAPVADTVDPNSELPEALTSDPDAEDPDTVAEAPDGPEPLKLPDVTISWAEDPLCTPLAVV